MDKDLPAPIGDCALTVTTRSKATTVSGGASLELDIAVEIMPRGGDLIPFGLTIPSWNFSPSATTETHSLYHAPLGECSGVATSVRIADDPAKALTGAPQNHLGQGFGRCFHTRCFTLSLFLPECQRRIHLGGALSGNPAGDHRGRCEQRGNAE